MTTFRITGRRQLRFAVAWKSFALLGVIVLTTDSTLDAQPTVVGYGHLTDRFGPHSIPLLPVGDKVQLGVFLGTPDPVASPTISVQLTQGDTTLTLDALPPGHPMYAGDHLYYKFIDFDPELAGSWEIVASDSTGTTSGIFTNAITAPVFLPFAENVSVLATSLNAGVSWSLPELTGIDVDGVAVRVIESVSGHHVWQSDVNGLETTNLSVPAGLLQQGVEYVFWVNLLDFEADYLENSSKIFSVPFRLTVEGDYNQNGTVDAADYTVWRDSVGGGALVNRGAGITGPVGSADYAIWRTNFGQSLGAASIAPSPVPEPTTLSFIFAIACWNIRPRRHPSSSLYTASEVAENSC